MDASANRKEGWTVGMVGVAATGALNDSRQTDSDTEQGDPQGKQLRQCAARNLHLKRNDQTRHVDQDGCPEYPAALADFCQTLPKGTAAVLSLHGQVPLLGDCRIIRAEAKSWMFENRL